MGIIDDNIEIVYGSNISEAERNTILKLINEFKITETIVKKFHMVQYKGCFELTDFVIKPFDTDIGAKNQFWNENRK